MESNKVVKVKSSDGKEMALSYNPLMLNLFFFDMLEGEDVPTETINMESDILKKSVLESVMQYCEFAHKNRPPKIQKPIK